MTRRIVICSSYLPYDAPDSPPNRELEDLVNFCRNHETASGQFDNEVVTKLQEEMLNLYVEATCVVTSLLLQTGVKWKHSEEINDTNTQQCSSMENVLLDTTLTRNLNFETWKHFEDIRGINHELPAISDLINFFEVECLHFEDAITDGWSKAGIKKSQKIHPRGYKQLGSGASPNAGRRRFTYMTRDDVVELLETHSVPLTDNLPTSKEEEYPNLSPTLEEEVGLTLEHLSQVVRTIMEVQDMVGEWDPQMMHALQFQNALDGDDAE
ncbi:hypothetical protein J437_LFUL013472 [Ladona fulva]|uniref:Uncharacterized protein n=1 Tax=Ladona fulva TaxID=123851 RepID=A0A8K0KHD5_LADFU|nr:hypothetical protein J437_LFUL013472 [Ladona fulva]